jgi:hypothetical protein
MAEAVHTSTHKQEPLSNQITAEAVRPSEDLQVFPTVEGQNEVASKYGNYRNYELARQERAYEETFRSFQGRMTKDDIAPEDVEVREVLGLAGVVCEEDAIAKVENTKPEAICKIPAFLNPVALSWLPLGAIGLPQPTQEESVRKPYKENLRAQRLPRADAGGQVPGYQAVDYKALGWPSSQGTSARIVSPEEDREIRRRLQSFGLAKAGSPVPVVGFGLDEILALNEPTPPWLIDGILRRGGSAFVYGPSGIGKSWFTYTLALGLAAGEGLKINDSNGAPVLTFGEHKGVRVGIIDGEMRRADFGARMRELIPGLGLKPVNAKAETLAPIEPGDFAAAIRNPELPQESVDAWTAEDAQAALDVIERRHEESLGNTKYAYVGSAVGVEVNLKNILFYTKTDQKPEARFVSLADREDKALIIGWAKRNNLDVIICDNLSTLSSGMENENDATAIEPANDLVVSCKAEDIAVIMIHHSNKSGESFRGSSNLLTVYETSVKLQKPEDTMFDAGARFAVRVEKDRNNGRLKLDKKTMTLSNGSWEIAEDMDTLLRMLVEEAKSLKYTTQGELAKAFTKDQATISRWSALAVAKGRVKEKEIAGWLKLAKSGGSLDDL